MNLAAMPQRGRLALGAALLALLLCGLAVPATADAGLICKGSIRAGEKDPAGLNENPVAYRFACSEPITSYSILLDQEIDAFETEVFALDIAGGVIPTDFFNCSGDQPGYGINCTGTYGGLFAVVPGTMNLSTAKLCDEPRPNPLLVVTRAVTRKNPDGTTMINSRGQATVDSTVGGPFDLGRPRGCPKSKNPRKTRIPPSNDTPAESVGDPVTAPVRRSAKRG